MPLVSFCFLYYAAWASSCSAWQTLPVTPVCVAFPFYGIIEKISFALPSTSINSLQPPPTAPFVCFGEPQAPLHEPEVIQCRSKTTQCLRFTAATVTKGNADVKRALLGAWIFYFTNSRSKSNQTCEHKKKKSFFVCLWLGSPSFTTQADPCVSSRANPLPSKHSYSSKIKKNESKNMEKTCLYTIQMKGSSNKLKRKQKQKKQVTHFSAHTNARRRKSAYVVLMIAIFPSTRLIHCVTNASFFFRFCAALLVHQLFPSHNINPTHSESELFINISQAPRKKKWNQG